MVLAKKISITSPDSIQWMPNVKYNHQLFTYSSWSIHQTLKQLGSFTPDYLPFPSTTLRFNQPSRPIVRYACVDMLHMAAANGTSAANLESLERVHPGKRLTGGASPDWWCSRIIPWKVRIYLSDQRIRGGGRIPWGIFFRLFEGHWRILGSKHFSVRKQDRSSHPGRVHGYRGFSCVHGSFVGSSPYRIGWKGTLSR